MRVDYVNGHEKFDGGLWFFDGKYVGYDDQIDATDFAPEGEFKVIVFHHRSIRDDFSHDDLETLMAAESIAEAEPFLDPVSTMKE